MLARAVIGAMAGAAEAKVGGLAFDPEPRANDLWTKSLKEYFEKDYIQGGEFRHPDYVYVGTDDWTWLHKPTGIQVWRDAIDLTHQGDGQVVFHYTSSVAFRNITHPRKKAAELWASLRTEGPDANAWWGKGIYSVPHPPDGWRDRAQLLDNNFRNMMAWLVCITRFGVSRSGLGTDAKCERQIQSRQIASQDTLRDSGPKQQRYAMLIKLLGGWC